jgi:polar amino acid transport system ATP-binding protein
VKSIQDLDKSVIAVSDLTYVAKGEVVVILGPSGSGKSTLLRSINGLETIEGGSIVVDGVRVHESRETLHQVRQLTGMVFQQFNLFPHRTVLQNITMAPIHVRKKPRPEAEEIAHALLGKVGLPDKAVFIDNGVKMEEAPADRFFSNPTQNRTKLFLSKILL